MIASTAEDLQIAEIKSQLPPRADRLDVIDYQFLRRPTAHAFAPKLFEGLMAKAFPIR